MQRVADRLQSQLDEFDSHGSWRSAAKQPSPDIDAQPKTVDARWADDAAFDEVQLNRITRTGYLISDFHEQFPSETRKIDSVTAEGRI